MKGVKTYEQLLAENDALRDQLDEAIDTLRAIRSGEVDALVIEGETGHELYTLKTADHTYRLFIESMNEGALTLNQDGLIVYCNSSFALLVGLPASKVIGIPFAEFVALPHQEAFASLLLDGRTHDRRHELAINHHSGRQVPCQLSVTALEFDEGVNLSMILTDLTALKETQQLLTTKNQQLEETNDALQDSNQALNRSNLDLMQFASVASHDLKEPLRKIQTFGTRLEEVLTGRLSEEEADLFRRLINSSARMQTLVNDVLRFSKLSDETVPAEPVDLNVVVGQIREDLELSISERQADIISTGLPVLAATRGQMYQLFLNLISNSLKFNTSLQPQIRLERVELTVALVQALRLPTTDYVVIAVVDNGIGFEEKYKERIFGMFQRLHNRREYTGTGIGLTIVKKIVENHRGYLDVQSQPGRGTTFWIALPTPISVS